MNRHLRAIVVPAAFLLVACGGSGDATPDAGADAAPEPETPELSAVELGQGIGPIRDMELGPIDPDLAAIGEEHYTVQCSACHKFDQRYVGPELGTVMSRRRPEFIMNMMVNANEMVARHPSVRELLAEYFTPMTQQDVDEEKARAILEYIRANQVEAN